MTDNAKPKAYTDQITSVIQDFVQLWIKFEAMLHNELAKTQNSLEEVDPGSQTRLLTDYGVFYRVSHSMYGKENLTMGELSHALSVPLSTATRMVDWLVSNGYIQRLPDPDDRRIVRVALTEKGQKLHQIIEIYTAERVQQVVSCLTDEEQTTLFALIHKVVSELKGIAS